MMYVESDISWVPYVTHFAPAVLCASISIMFMSLLEDKQPIDSRKQTNVENNQHKLETDSLMNTNDGFFDRLKRVPRTIDSLSFYFLIFVCACCKGLVDSFLLIFIKDTLHGSQLIMGIAVLVTCTFNVIVFYNAERALNYFSTSWTLLMSVIAFVLRFGLYWTFGLYLVNPWYILFAETLHGFTFALMWCSAISKTAQLVEGLNLRNFAVGLTTALIIFGNATGSLVSGIILDAGFTIVWVWQNLTAILAITATLWYLKVLYQKVFEERNVVSSV